MWLAIVFATAFLFYWLGHYRGVKYGEQLARAYYQSMYKFDLTQFLEEVNKK